MSKTRTLTHGKVTKGDTVKIKGTHGRYVVQWFEHFEDRQSEVTVVGGASGRQAWRTFHDDRVVTMPKRRKRRV